MSREHQWRTERGYQYPAAKKTIKDETLYPPIVGWIVNSQADRRSIYGVIRYFPDFPRNERAAWLESPESFADVAQAEAWIVEQVGVLKAELS